MTVSQSLKGGSGDLWRNATEHPFVAELGAGTLPLVKFRRYFIQDYVFVRDLTRTVALAMAKSPTMEDARELGGFLGVLLGAEDALFVRTFRSLRVPVSAWRNSEPLPATAAFCDFLVRLGYAASFREICTALLVTEGAYMEWAERLHRGGAKPGVQVYQQWIDIHSEASLGPTVRYLQSVVDSAPKGEADRLQPVFDQACRLESAFWDMAYEAPGR